MNRIIRAHYPVAPLPEDLRDAVADSTHVSLTLEREAPSPRGKGENGGSAHFGRWLHLRRRHFETAQEIAS